MRGKKEVQMRDKRREDKKRSDRKKKWDLLGIEPMPGQSLKGWGGKRRGKKRSSPQNRTWVPLMNGHNHRSCANLG